MAIQVKPRGSNALETTVSDLSNRLKRTVEDAFGSVRVRGEISGYRGPVSSGHMYFTLKDDRSAIDAVVWRGVAGKLTHRPEEGLEVIATGRLTTYPGRSKYQIVIENLEPAGEGALMAQLDRLRKKLAAEGLFAEERKTPLPFLPRTIGVVTSPTGAVIRDILHRLNDRFPTRVLVWPVRVQGETTPQEVATAIMGFNRMGEFGLPVPDLLIVARGGGSLEDLWGFNDELVVRAAAASTIPLISAVGHETDTTLIDHASDFRAPTPTAAAEKAVPVKRELEAWVADQSTRMRTASSRSIEARRTALVAAVRGLSSPDALLALPRQRVENAGARLGRALERFTDRARTRFDRVSDRLALDRLEEATARRAEKITTLHGRAERALGASVRRAGDRLAAGERLLARTGRDAIRTKRADLDRVSTGIRPAALGVRANRERDRFETLLRRIERASVAERDARRARIDAASRLLRSLSFTGVLDRGFALVTDPQGDPVRSAHSLAPGMPIALRFADGSVDASVGKGSRLPQSRRRKKEIEPPEQATLL